RSVKRPRLVANISLNTALTAVDSGATRSRMRPTARTGVTVVGHGTRDTRHAIERPVARQPMIASAKTATTALAMSDARLMFLGLALGTEGVGDETGTATSAGAANELSVAGAGAVVTAASCPVSRVSCLVSRATACSRVSYSRIRSTAC